MSTRSAVVAVDSFGIPSMTCQESALPWLGIDAPMAVTWFSRLITPVLHPPPVTTVPAGQLTRCQGEPVVGFSTWTLSHTTTAPRGVEAHRTWTSKVVLPSLRLSRPTFHDSDPKGWLAMTGYRSGTAYCEMVL